MTLLGRTGIVSASIVEPPGIGDLSLWLRPDLAALSLNGNDVESWTNQGSHSLVLSKYGTAPIYEAATSVGGKTFPTIDFRSGKSVRNETNRLTVQDYTIFNVAYFPSILPNNNQQQAFYCWAGNRGGGAPYDTGNLVSFRRNSSGIYQAVSGEGDYDFKTGNSSGFPPNGMLCVYGTWVGDHAHVYTAHDGLLIDDTVDLSNRSYFDYSYVGFFNTVGSSYYKLGEIAWFRGALDAGQMTAMKAYLNARYGINFV